MEDAGRLSRDGRHGAGDRYPENPDADPPPPEPAAPTRGAAGPALPDAPGVGRTGRPKRVRPLPKYEPFPVEALPEPLRSYVTEGAAALHCDPALLAVFVLAVAAGLI